MTEGLPVSVAITLATATMAVARSMLLAVTAGLLVALARPSASARHQIWLTTLVACALISLLPSFPSSGVVVALPMPDWIEGRVAGALGLGLTGGPYPARWNLLHVAWATVVLVLLTRLSVDLISVRRLVRRSSPVAPGVVMVDELRVPAVSGLWRPVILVPPDAGSWAPGERRAILAHERAHAQRRDPLALMMTRLVCVLCWFNPVVWWLARRLEIARECACDDAVLNTGVDRFVYARQLVEMGTRVAQTRSSGATACLVGATRPLASRIRRLLATNARRGTMRRTAVLASSAVLALATLLLAVVPDTGRLHFLPVRSGTLVVEGGTRMLVRDMWPIAFPQGDRGRVKVTLHTITSLRAQGWRRAADRPLR